MRGVTDFAGARVCRAEPGIMWPTAVCRLAAGDGPGRAIGEGQEGAGVARHGGECGF
jgi:hypothetical protein